MIYSSQKHIARDTLLSDITLTGTFRHKTFTEVHNNEHKFEHNLHTKVIANN